VCGCFEVKFTLLIFLGICHKTKIRKIQFIVNSV
jgi:hypothetical protein